MAQRALAWVAEVGLRCRQRCSLSRTAAPIAGAPGQLALFTHHIILPSICCPGCSSAALTCSWRAACWRVCALARACEAPPAGADAMPKEELAAMPKDALRVVCLEAHLGVLLSCTTQVTTTTGAAHGARWSSLAPDPVPLLDPPPPRQRPRRVPIAGARP